MVSRLHASAKARASVMAMIYGVNCNDRNVTGLYDAMGWAQVNSKAQRLAFMLCAKKQTGRSHSRPSLHSCVRYLQQTGESAFRAASYQV